MMYKFLILLCALILSSCAYCPNNNTIGEPSKPEIGQRTRDLGLDQAQAAHDRYTRDIRKAPDSFLRKK